MALSPMARQVADVGNRRQAVQEAQQEAAACRERLHAVQLQLASSLDCTEAQRQECTRVSTLHTEGGIDHTHLVSPRSYHYNMILLNLLKPDSEANFVGMVMRDLNRVSLLVFCWLAVA